VKSICVYISLIVILAGKTVAHNNEPTPSSRIVSGKVFDKESGEALAGVKIQVKGTDNFCYTDLNGSYILRLNLKTESEIEVGIVGYTPVTLKSSEVGLEKDLALSIQ
jgi:hypothetical protein